MNKFRIYEEVTYNPGIDGFVKAHRHVCGPAVVLCVWGIGELRWAGVYWVKRLHHAATPIQMNLFQVSKRKAMKAVERAYELSITGSPPPEAFSDKPDFQRQRVYDWEDDNIILGYKPMTWEGCQRFLSYVWDRIGTGPEPLLRKNRRFLRPTAFSNLIYFPAEKIKEYTWTMPVLLHEIAHILKFEDKHGPQFVRCYIDLCTRFLGMKRERLMNSADRYGVVYD